MTFTQSKTQAYTSEPAFDSNYEISSDVSNAYRAYGLANLNKTPAYISLKLYEFIDLLRQQGKIEGKDFVIEENGDRPWLNVYNSKGQAVLRSEYDLDTQKLLGCEISTYKNNKLIRCISKDGKNRTALFSENYDNKDIAQSSFTKEKITYQTKAQDYIEYLKQNKLSYKVHYDNDETVVQEYDANNNLLTQTNFYRNGVSRSEYNSNEEETRRIDFTNEETHICNYIEKCKSKTYKIKDINPEYFTDAKLTYNTKPEEYIKYLEAKNINYKIKNFENKFGKGTKITEFDEKSEEITSTAWVHENGEFERICRWEFNDNNRRRLDFYKDETDEMIITY